MFASLKSTAPLTQGVLTLFLFLCGCSSLAPNVPHSVEPLWGEDSEGESLCRIYKQHGLLSSATGSCSTGEWKLLLPQIRPGEDGQAPDQKQEHPSAAQMKVARDALQHGIFMRSNILCKKFKDEFIRKPARSAFGSEYLSILLSAAAVATNTPDVAKVLAATAGASNAISGLLGERYVGDVDTALLGIEVARTKIFKQTAKGRKENIFKYPISQAVNDAVRYHSVCNLVEGYSAAQTAARNAAQPASTPAQPASTPAQPASIPGPER